MTLNGKDTLDLEQSVLPWLGRTMKALDFFIANQFAKYGVALTKVQFVLLRVLSRNNGIPQNDLAFITNRDKASLTRLVNTMERKELVKRESSESDKRVNLIYITQKGRDVLSAANPTLQKINEQVQNDLSQSEIESTIRTLKKISTNINSEFITHYNESK